MLHTCLAIPMKILTQDLGMYSILSSTIFWLFAIQMLPDFSNIIVKQNHHLSHSNL